MNCKNMMRWPAEDGSDAATQAVSSNFMIPTVSQLNLRMKKLSSRDINISHENGDQEFEHLMKEQRERSQTASKGIFKGG